MFEALSDRLGKVGSGNLFLDWTFSGWVVALAMACGRKDPPVKTGTMTSQLPQLLNETCAILQMNEL
jgi:hypothetical protein